MAELAEGQIEENSLRNAGFSEEEVSQWKGETVDSLSKGGFSQREINDYFGVKDPDTSAMKGFVKENLQKEKEKRQTIDASPKPVEAEDWVDALAAGWGMGVTNLVSSGPSPITLPENASRAMKVAMTVGQIAGDVPAMIAGGVIGGVTGSAVGTPALPVVGTVAGGVVGAEVGANALPQALRKIMMDHYEKGDINTFSEFWDRFTGASWEAIKGGVVGGLTFGAGRYAGAASKVAGQTVSGLTKTAAELTTMVSAGSALEGRIPDADEFLNGGIVLAGLGGSVHVARKLRNGFSQTASRPLDILDEAAQDVQIKQQMLQSNPDLPIETGNFEVVDSLVSGAKEKIQVAKDFLKEKGPKKIDEVYKDFVNDLDPVKQIVKLSKKGEEIPAAQDPYKLMRTYKDYQGKVQRAYEFNTIDYNTGKANGDGLKPILKRVPKKENVPLSDAETKILGSLSDEQVGTRDTTWKKFTSYLVAERAVELEKRGIETGVDIEAAKEVVTSGRGEYVNVTKELREYQRRIMQYAKDSGVLSEKSARLMDQANENYIPFYRLLEEDQKAGETGLGIPFKKIKGSNKKILDPIESVFKNTEAVFRIAEKNRAVEALVKVSESSPAPFLKRVKASQEKVNVKAEEVQKFLENNGYGTSRDSVKKDLKSKGLDLTDEQIDAAFKNEQHNFIEVSEGFSIFRPQKESLDNNQFVFFRNGKREVYEAPKDLAEAVNSLNGHPGLTGIWAGMFRGFAQTLRVGVTITPDFTMRNFFRDQFTAGSQSRFQQLPFVDALKSIGSIFKKDASWQEFLSSGGASGSFGEVQRTLDNNTWGVLKETGHLDQAWNVIKSPFRAMGVLSELVENSTRLAEFKRGGGVGGSLDQKIEAGFASREVTVDFSRSGAKMRAVSAFVPFMNVGVQGTDQAIRSFKENPTQFAAKATAMLTLPSVLLWWANKDDSRYQDAANWEKDLFWIVPTDTWEKSTFADAQSRPPDLKRQNADGSWEVNNGITYRFPKPFLLGTLFGTLPERSLDAFYKQDPDKFSGFTETLMNGLIPNVIPPLVSGPLEQFMNKSLFTGNEVVSNQMEKYLPEYQYREYTSETAKQIAKIVGYIPGLRDLGPKDAKLNSPLVIDNYIRTWTGTAGKYATELIDATLVGSGLVNQPPKPLRTIEEYPVIRAFMTRHPKAKLQPIEDFRENFEKTSKTVATVQMLAQKGDIKAAEKLINANPESFIKLDSINSAINNQNKMIQKINLSPDMSSADKRQLIDALYYQMSQTAKMGNELLKQYRSTIDK